MFDQVSIDRGLQIDQAFEHSAFEPALCENAEKAFDGVEPGRGGWRKMESEARMPVKWTLSAANKVVVPLRL